MSVEACGLDDVSLNGWLSAWRDSDTDLSVLAAKVSQSSAGVMRLHAMPFEGGGRVEIGGSFEWGGKDGGNWKGYAEGEAYDNRGNYVEVKVERNGDGSGRVDVAGGHEK